MQPRQPTQQPSAPVPETSTNEKNVTTRPFILMLSSILLAVSSAMVPFAIFLLTNDPGDTNKIEVFAGFIFYGTLTIALAHAVVGLYYTRHRKYSTAKHLFVTDSILLVLTLTIFGAFGVAGHAQRELTIQIANVGLVVQKDFILQIANTAVVLSIPTAIISFFQSIVFVRSCEPKSI